MRFKKRCLKFCICGLVAFPLFAHAGNVNDILDGLNNTDPYIRFKTMASIKIETGLDPKIIDAVIRRIADRDGKVRDQAKVTVSRMKAIAVPELKKILDLEFQNPTNTRDMGEPPLEVSIVHILGEIGGADVVPILIETLASNSDDLMKASISAVGKIGPRAEAAIPALGKIVERGIPSDVWDVLRVLNKIGPKSIPELIRLLQKRPWPGEYGEGRMNYPGMGKDIIYALGKMGAKAKSSEPTLIPLLENEHEEIRQATAWALGNIGGSAKISIPVLKQTLNDKNPDVRAAAAKALRQIGVTKSKKMKNILNEEKERKAAGF